MDNDRLARRMRSFGVLAGLAGTLAGGTALLGWIVGSEALKGSFVAGITMKTNTAVCVVLIGTAITLAAARPRVTSALATRFELVLAGVVTVVAFATLAQHVLGVDLGIDQLLFEEPVGAVATDSPNRMGLLAATCLSLLGLARLLLDWRTRAGRAPFQMLALLVNLIMSVPLLGFLFDARVLFSVGGYTAIALPTAVALWLFGLALLLARPDAGFMRLATGQESGAVMVRRLLPAALLVPVLFMLLYLTSLQLGYDQTNARALLVLAFSLVFAGLIWRTAAVVTRQEQIAAQAERELRAQLERSLSQLSDEDRRKTEFIAVLAHELRNPLAPVRNAISVLRAATGKEGQSERLYTLIERQCEHLARLIEDLMDVSRIAQNRLELVKGPVQLSSMVTRAAESCRFLMDAKRQRFELRLPARELEFAADEARLTQVVTNLLNNAIRYTPAGGSIELKVELEQGTEPGTGRIVLSVSDDGIGIDPAQLPLVSRLFFQAGRDEQRGQRGLGIGLALVRRLVELHGGGVEISSAGVGKGCTVVVTLPYQAVESATEASPESPRASARLGGMRVLIVEDNLDSAEVLAALVTMTGASVRACPDGEQALETFDSFEPDVVLLDIGLPGMGGYDVAREMRRRSGLQPFIVALTGWGSAEDRAESQRAGIDRHVVKPFEPNALLELLQQLRSEDSSRVNGAVEDAAPSVERVPLGS